MIRHRARTAATVPRSDGMRLGREAMQFDCLIRGGTAVFPERGVMPADIAIRDGKIAAILQPGEATGEAGQIIDATGKHVFPGIIDAHLHFGFAEPLTEYGTETIYE